MSTFVPIYSPRQMDYDATVQAIVSCSTLAEVDEVMEEVAGSKNLSNRDYIRLTYIAKAYIDAHGLCP